MPRPRPSPRALLAWLAVAAVAAGVVVFAVVRARDAEPAAEASLDVALVGDSFVEQSRPQFLAHTEAQGLDAEVVAFGGTALCDYRDAVVGFAARRPTVLVLSFAGNDVTACMNRTDTPSTAEQTAEEYASDFEAVVADVLDASPDTRIYLVPPPPVREPRFEANAAAMRAMYAAFAADHPQTALIDVAATLGPDGAFHESLPCAAWEAAVCGADGTVALREADGIHLTAAGGERYARALLDAIGAGVD